jgi:hypothetical protein
MDASVPFPLIVFQKSSCSMFVVETPERIFDYMEPPDIGNGEYLCWDANGRAVRISISGRRMTGISHVEAEVPITEAFRRYSDVFGLDVDTTGPVDQVLCRLKQGEVPLLRKGRRLAKLFRRDGG